MAGEYLEQFTFEYLINKALSYVPDTLDKREGSIMYDALAPACMELSDYYMRLRQNYKDTYVMTAANDYLDYRMQEQGLERYQATYTIKRVDFATSTGAPMPVPLGVRLSTISETSVINYQVTMPYIDKNGSIVPGAYQVTCETVGTVGNSYVGEVQMIDYVYGLATAIMSNTIVAARDMESDTEALTRYIQHVNVKPFGGNIAQYDEMVRGIDGVGEVQIYPTWQGPGTVLLSVIDPEYMPVTDDFIELLEAKIDPENAIGNKGEGLGLAPYNHKVTVKTATPLPINIETNLSLVSGTTPAQVETDIITHIDAYLLELRKEWGVPDQYNRHSLGVFVARINAAILQVGGIANVTNTKLNGVENDIVLTQTALLQQLPVIGTVILHD